MASFGQWQSREYPAGDAPFRVAEIGGPQPYFHDALDRVRTGWRSTPEATYPDGYLGTINTRRQDRLFDGLKKRTSAKPYTRGIHKGERRDPDDYLWPEEFNLWSALMTESVGMRFVSPGLSLMESGTLTNDGKPGPNQPTPRGTPARNGLIRWSQPATNPDRATELRRLAPPWGGGRGPGVPVGNAMTGGAQLR